jgi:hypothetical protein
MTHRLAIFGDSHYACLKAAFDAGLVDLPDQVDLEFWGHVGGRFRQLGFADGAITPSDDYTAERFAKFSTRNRKTLPMRDFDTVFFMGCRISTFSFFAGLIREARRGVHISAGLRRRIFRDYLASIPYYAIAREAAAVQAARIILMPVSFPTWAPGLDQKYAPSFPEAQSTRPEERGLFWAEMEAVMAADGITLLPQAEDTVTEGLFTKLDFAVEGYETKPDVVHRNTGFGAQVFAALLETLEI